jgi:hypothetical protein
MGTDEFVQSKVARNRANSSQATHISRSANGPASTSPQRQSSSRQQRLEKRMLTTMISSSSVPKTASNLCLTLRDISSGSPDSFGSWSNTKPASLLTTSILKMPKSKATNGEWEYLRKWKFSSTRLRQRQLRSSSAESFGKTCNGAGAAVCPCLSSLESRR